MNHNELEYKEDIGQKKAVLRLLLNSTVKWCLVSKNLWTRTQYYSLIFTNLAPNLWISKDLSMIQWIRLCFK